MSHRAPHLRLVTAADPAPRAGQMSRPNGFDRPAVITRHEATVFWADLMARRCGSREACAVQFGVTFQTACNWFDGFSCPTGDKVLHAVRLWPQEFALAHGCGADRRAA